MEKQANENPELKELLTIATNISEKRVLKAFYSLIENGDTSQITINDIVDRVRDMGNTVGSTTVRVVVNKFGLSIEKSRRRAPTQDVFVCVAKDDFATSVEKINIKDAVEYVKKRVSEGALDGMLSASRVKDGGDKDNTLLSCIHRTIGGMRSDVCGIIFSSNKTLLKRRADVYNKDD